MTATLQRWTWYAARRAGLHLDEADDDFADPELLESSIRSVAPTLRLTAADIDDLIEQSRGSSATARARSSSTPARAAQHAADHRGPGEPERRAGRRQFPDRAQADARGSTSGRRR